MKHVTNNFSEQTSQNGKSTFTALPIILLTILLFLAAGLLGQLSAQCDLACDGGNPDFPIEISIGNDCEINLSSDDVLESPALCPGDKQLTVRDGMSSIIAQGTNQVVFDAESWQGSTLSVTVTDVQTGTICVSFIRPIDNAPPVMNCITPVMISCIADTMPTNIQLGFPSVTDNCLSGVDLVYVNDYQDFGCAGADNAYIDRIWRATDAAGNTSVCIQSIFLNRPNLTDIVFPSDTTFSCENPDASIFRAGQPTLYGIPVENGNRCDLVVTYTDNTTYFCGNIEYAILRTWTIFDPCGGTNITGQQTISIVDNIAPQITCPATLTVSTNTGVCYTTVTLPSALVEDSCDPDASFFVVTSWGTVGTGPHPFVPVGSHQLQYTGLDNCGNTSTCTTTLNVIDDEEPTAVCENSTIVAVPSGGVAQVSAINFDDGSHDNCATTIYYKARRMDAGGCNGANGDDSSLPNYQEWMDDKVFFCCEEVGQLVTVIFRVYDVNPGTGPVDPVRELPGGDLYSHFNDCMMTVEVQDKIAPTLVCPHDTTVNCTFDYSNLSVFGSVSITDNCGYGEAYTTVNNINSCDVGTILRIFTATDAAGNSASCTQTITVVQDNPLSESQIAWPTDYTTDLCGASTDPENLPAGFDFPTINNPACMNIGISYEDDFFDIAFPGCYKILRRWTVVDWCQYNPDVENSGGRFTKTQIIKVEDNDAPVLTCPANITVGVGQGCDFAQVNLNPATALDCNNNIIITNDSPSANASGANASGTYPRGTTLVKFEASDRCGNVSNCQVAVTVEDKTLPSPVCIVGLSVNLSTINGQISAVVQASAFDGGSSDNCTADEDLLMTIRKSGTGSPTEAPTATQLTFGCGDEGTQLVEFWVSDEDGNSNFCQTVIAIQDNANLCPTVEPVNGMIAGGIRTEMGDEVEDVMVEVSELNYMQAFTDGFGFFELLNVPYGGNYNLSANRNGDNLNGISTLDLILMSKHILGVQYLNSPYKIIAADVNRSNSISTLDLIALRKMILGISTEFPEGNQSWRFIDADFNFPDPTNPFATTFPETVQVNNFAQNQMTADFVAVKMGDVDNSANPSSLLGVENRITSGKMNLYIEDQELSAGEMTYLDVTTDAMNQIEGFQFTLTYDAAVLEYEGVENGDLPDFVENNMGLHTEKGWITSSWNTDQTYAASPSTKIFRLIFRAKQDITTLSNLIHATDAPTTAEAYDKDGGIWNVALNWENKQPTAIPGIILHQNRPNPFQHETVIGFELSKAGNARLSVYDLTGKLIYSQEANYETGYHEVVLYKEQLKTGGMLYYQLETDEFSATKKMTSLF
ncbi:MAG TPA: HYR domain-containing protein [Saprospiraceae bacterium]|nr:HYR domain-containing protein [Saprospiraceae bacterium]HMQ84560.1 HYR domain-containing protein [Saprospiraceae bacterium]